MKILRAGLAVCALSMAMLLGTGTAGAAVNLGNVTCNGGLVPSGMYQSLTIEAGATCWTDVAPGVVEVHGLLTLMSSSTFDAAEPGTAKLWVQNNVVVGTNAALNLGCYPEAPTSATIEPSDCSADYLNGALIGTNALAVVVHNVRMRGDFTLTGSGDLTGGGFGSGSCELPVTFGGPAFSTIEDSNVNGAVSVANLKTCWFGMFRNTVRGNITVRNNSFDDPDGTEIGSNSTNNALSCSGNTPAAQIGDSGAGPNTARGPKLGECASL
jgi:hypothetical protein